MKGTKGFIRGQRNFYWLSNLESYFTFLFCISKKFQSKKRETEKREDKTYNRFIPCTCLDTLEEILKCSQYSSII